MLAHGHNGAQGKCSAWAPNPTRGARVLPVDFEAACLDRCGTDETSLDRKTIIGQRANGGWCWIEHRNRTSSPKAGTIFLFRENPVFGGLSIRAFTSMVFGGVAEVFFSGGPWAKTALNGKSSGPQFGSIRNERNLPESRFRRRFIEAAGPKPGKSAAHPGTNWLEPNALLRPLQYRMKRYESRNGF